MARTPNSPPSDPEPTREISNGFSLIFHGLKLRVLRTRLVIFRSFSLLLASPKKALTYPYKLFGRVPLRAPTVSLIARTTVTLTIGEGVARAVVFKGRRAVKWHTVELQGSPSSINGDDGGYKDSTATALKVLFQRIGKKRGPVLVDLPFSATLVRYVEAPKVRFRIVEQVVKGQTVDSIPFRLDQVEVPWYLLSGGGNPHALSIAVTKKALKEQAAILRASGFYMKAAYSKVTSLASLCHHTNAVVGYLDSESAIFVLVTHGIPRVSHQVSLSGSNESSESMATRAARGIERVFAHYQTIEPDSEISEFPLVLTGPLAKDSSLVDDISRLCEAQALPVKAGVGGASGFSLDEYALNCGLVLSHRSRVRSGAKTKVAGALDLLPEHQKRRLIPTAALAAASGLLVAGALALQIQRHIEGINGGNEVLLDRMAALETQDRGMRLESAAIQHLQIELNTTSKQIGNIQTYFATLSSSLNGRLQAMDTIESQANASMVEVSSVLQSKTGFTIAGSAATYDAVTSYIHGLLDSGVFSDVQVRSVAASSNQSGSPASGSRASFLIMAESGQ